VPYRAGAPRVRPSDPAGRGLRPPRTSGTPRSPLPYLEVAAVRLALVGGLPGTGKTTLGGALADRFGAVLISGDRVRKEIAGIDPLQPGPAAFGEGLYSPEHTSTPPSTPGR
jgi:AAA domain-containing protein